MNKINYYDTPNQNRQNGKHTAGLVQSVKCSYPECEEDGVNLVERSGSWICERHAEVANVK